MRSPKELRRLAGCLAATVAIGLAGCGGSSSGGLTKAQLAAAADAACSTYNTAAAEIPAPSDFPRTPATAAAYLDKLKPLGVAFERTVLSLKPNSSAKSVWDRFTTAGKHMTALTDDAAAKAHADDQAGLIKVAQAVSSYERSTVTPAATQLGATVCAM